MSLFKFQLQVGINRAGGVSLFKFQLQVGIARGGGVFFQISISGWYQYQFGGWWVHRSNFQNYIN